MKMSFSPAQGLILLVTASMLVASHADTIVVGGSERWRSAYNYTDWALKHGPFYVNDKLVFQYDPPSETTAPHNVYMLPNLWSFKNCSFRGAKLLANATQGGGNGFEFTLLKTWRRPRYFASGEGNGADCKDGMMKFFVVPLPRW